MFYARLTCSVASQAEARQLAVGIEGAVAVDVQVPNSKGLRACLWLTRSAPAEQ